MDKPLTGNQTEKGQPRSILVTGAHRSGTTWVGKMLAANDQIGYISEPLNVWHRPGVMRTPVKHWYTYICKDNEEIFSKGFEETLSFQYHTTKEIQSLKSIKDIIRMARDWNTFSKGRIKGQRVLVKDPFAVFSSLWFFKRFGFDIVITVRHPAAIASSLKRLNWSFDFSDLLEQPLLIRDLLSPFYDELVEMVVSPGDVIEQSCLLWRMIYATVASFQEQQPKFIILRHEDIAKNPIEEFCNVYGFLGVDFTPQVEWAIKNSSSEKNPNEAPRRIRHSYHLNSKANLEKWKQRLDLEEIARVRELTADVSPFFYTEKDWE